MQQQAKLRTQVEATCTVCGNQFAYERIGFRPRKFCSDVCKKAKFADLGRLPARPCEACGEMFEPRRQYGKQPAARFCSLRCRSPEILYPNRAARKKAQDHRRRARKHQAPYETFDSTLVYERDEWTCGLCGEAVDPRLQHPDHMAASVDHIVPLSRGGMHVLDNCQCAHWICNSRKGDRIDGAQQLLSLPPLASAEARDARA